MGNGSFQLDDLEVRADMEWMRQQILHSIHGYVQDDKLSRIRKKTIGPRGVTTSSAMPDRMVCGERA